MDKEIVSILKKYGCAYMESDNKEMIEEIVNFAKEQGKALITSEENKTEKTQGNGV